MSVPSPAETRKRLRQQLAELKSSEHEHLVTRAIENFLLTPEYRRCRNIAAFYPVRHELDLMPLIESCWAENKKVYLPRLLPKPFQKMCFLPYSASTPMKPNRYNIPEPDLPIRRQIEIRQLDIVITPLLAFGTNGERLGMGGGYYDRTFAFQNRARAYRRPRLWSIALEMQSCELQANPWDVNIHGVATEEAVYRYD